MDFSSIFKLYVQNIPIWDLQLCVVYFSVLKRAQNAPEEKVATWHPEARFVNQGRNSVAMRGLEVWLM